MTEQKQKKLIINAFVEMCSGHQSPGLWRHPDDESHKFNDVGHWVELAKLLEAAKVHGIFIADVLGGYDVYNGTLDAAIRSGAQWPVNEPLAVVSAMAAATKSIGFGVTVSTTYEQPYHLARRLSTVDHLSKGRLGWNIVTSYLDSAARNLGFTEQPKHDDRYAQAEEYVQVIYKLLESSWRDDAVILDREKGIYTDPTRVREINHKGRFFNVLGPHICQPSPQRTPLLLQAGTSKAGKQFAAQHAEAIFVSAHAPVVCAKNIAEIRELAKTEFGRTPSNIKVLALVTPILGRTTEEAQEKFEEYKKYASSEGALALFCGWTGIDLGKYGDEEELRHVESNAVRSTVEGYARFSPGTSKWTKHTIAEHISIGGNGPVLVGTPTQVVDGLLTWVKEADVDGFNLAYTLFPQSFKDIAELLLPELQSRGLFWDDYAVPGGTYRENFYQKPGQSGPLDEHVAASYRWKAE
ncbi:Nitrilotriacetate monooxygenase component A/pristinamycin IIA synthase subunit A [Mytilinidion resinicola]|uniref:Nitrilotriacetate monooxygenase component A/pristinamycin IIA synthase subunit A n=1 Tax=Mytilinidion resinicola TaxID=574789 RepID=A0A6A6Y9R5_9PEZI|nr:Nitrilotriacetate monooxygenase component A/pristinamycin IIA synthase subunit A [Mytilinidion resinicola]KAF2804734.1 Nitrilotriacetate monooxygenase component A/pristinamycin IIA synthase subunit A [Mytilinidion resinicola]